MDASMTIKIHRDLSGLRKLRARLKTLDNKTKIQFGFFPEDSYGPENDNLPVATVARANNDGDFNNPSRPFFDMALMDFRKKSIPQIERLFEGVLTGDGQVRRRMDALGDLGVKEVQDNIEFYNGQNPINSPAWTAFKLSVGSPAKPLLFTGRMLDSVKKKIVKEG